MEIRKNAGRISPVFMGDYDNTTVYRRLDWVYYGGTSYICIKNNTLGITPSNISNWQKLLDSPSDSIIYFDEATTRENISSGEKLSVILGKIKKCISEIKNVAFTGSYNDLVNTPIKINDDGTNFVVYLNQNKKIIGLENQLYGVIFKNEGDEPGQSVRFITRQPSSGDIIFGDNTGDANLTFPFSFMADSNGYGYKKYKTNNITYFGDVYVKNILNTTEQISANTTSGNITGALASKAMMADYNNKINAINSNLAEKQLEFIPAEGVTNHLCVIKYIELPNNRIYFWFEGSIVIDDQFERNDVIGYIDAPFDIINASSMIGYEDAVSNVDAQTMIILSMRSNNRVITRGKIQPNVWVGFLTGSLGEKCII